MFRSLCKNVVSRLAKPQHPPSKISSTFPFLQQTARITSQPNNSSSSPEAEDPSLTISYLQSSCGLSSQSALSASKMICVKSTEKADRVLQLLKDHGLSDTQIATVISKFPGLLLVKADETLTPKLEYLRRIITSYQLADVLSMNPYLMQASLEKRVVASVEYLKSIDPSGSALVLVLKLTNLALPYMRQNIKTLRDNGATEAVIVKLLKNCPRMVFGLPTKFRDAVKMVKSTGLDPKSLQFANAVKPISLFSKSTMDRKMELYRRLGWSDKDILFVIFRQPSFLGLSDKLILEKIRFFKEIVGWDMSFLSKYPVILCMSVNKRVAPRLAVLDILMQKGFIKRNRQPTGQLLTSERLFYRNSVDKYKEQAPEVVKAFHGELEFKGWGWIDKQATS